jgi:tRNA-Thr(GGU) m(6)t(6)A37 methyltransferase TsaA
MKPDATGAVTMQPIGVVRSPVIEGVDEGWGNVVAEIHLQDKYALGLRGLEEFSHVIVVFLMHQATFRPDEDLVRRPRGRADMPEIGIFAQRAKHRPNPIGLTAVRLLFVEGSVLTVRGLDAIDGSPVFDIKPYFATFDQVEDAIQPEWVDRLMEGYF